MTVHFDDLAAQRLELAATSAAEQLRLQSAERHRSARRALESFRGGYARRFEQVVCIESEDRARLAATLDELAESVALTAAAAVRERTRQHDVAEWQKYEAGVNAHGALVNAVGITEGGRLVATGAGAGRLWKARPDSRAVVAAPIRVGFQARPRPRGFVPGGQSRGTTSAMPSQLRGFAGRARAMNRDLEHEADRLSEAWRGFVQQCGWARIEGATFESGFRRLLAESDDDARWIERVATAFEQAGAGTLPTHSVSLAVAGRSPKLLARLLFTGAGRPAQVSVTWRALMARAPQTADALIEQYAYELAGLDGVPFEVRDVAARAVLDDIFDPPDDGGAHSGESQTQRLQRAYARMGFAPGERSLKDFRADLDDLRSEVLHAEQMSRGEPVMLVGLGRHDGAVTAAIAVGDLATAPKVGVFVSGMNSNVRGIGEALPAFHSMKQNGEDMAFVTWIGYRSPGVGGVISQQRADAGAVRLVDFLEGVTESREVPVDRLIVMGHSYGTNVAAEALTKVTVPVSAYVAIGSAGLKPGTEPGDLRVAERYATHAKRDNIAQIGVRSTALQYDYGTPPVTDEAKRLLDAAVPREDPRELDGFHVFSSEKTKKGAQVTMHNLLNPIDWQSSLGKPAQYLADTLDGTIAAEEVGYLHPSSSTVASLLDIMNGAL
ncbi:hypothetical protein JSO19_04280 [Leucobacter sp. UCMA 4100]|uniref:alpha/beta hydrolase n=1 Tax=Leucobacter sp. UCMA 4100 TaxID=2810534 RepID=UPI0022EBA2D2|nr:alpha/beta hydrolase [Leucobacter sp. UCMA 4100]MDA3146592.1 hypothetical protein [Leucobacter sp. UCMA 4100]